MLTQLLNRLADHDQPFSSVHGTVKHTRYPGFGYVNPTGGPPLTGGQCKPNATAITRLLSIYAVPPTRVRVECDRTLDGRESQIVNGLNEQFSWIGDGRFSTYSKHTREHSRMQGEYEEFLFEALSPLPDDYRRHFGRMHIFGFLKTLSLHELEKCTIAGRECLSFRGCPQRLPRYPWKGLLDLHADEFVFAADLEYAVLLSIEGRVHGNICESYEVQQISFNLALDDTIFSPDISWNLVIPSEHVTLEDARGRVPFTILMPTSLPKFHSQPRLVTLTREDGGSSARIVATYENRGDPNGHLIVFQRPNRDAFTFEKYEWTRQQFDNLTIYVSAPTEKGGWSLVAFEQDGTHVLLMSALPTDHLVRIATSFEPI